jgi:hypothetical protein
MSQNSQSLKSRLKRTGAALLIGTAALGLVACGGDKGDGGGKSSTSSNLVSADLKGGKSPIDQSFSYKQGTELDVDAFFTATSDNEEMPFTYDSSTFDKKSGATIITNLVSKDESDSFSIGRLELYGVNQDNIVALDGDEATDGKLDIFRKIRAFDVSFSAPGGETGKFTIGALEVDSLKIKGNGTGADEGLKDGQELAMGLDSFSLGGVYLKDLSIDAMEAEEIGISMNAADLRFGAMEGGKFGGFYAADVEYSMEQSPEMRAMMMGELDASMRGMFEGPLGNMIFPQNSQGTVAEMSWDGLNISGLMEYLRSGEKPPYSAKNLIWFGGMEVRDTVAKVNGKQAASVGLSVLEPIEFEWLVPTRISSSEKNGVYNIGAFMPEGAEALTALVKDNGLEAVKYEADFLWDYDTKKGNAKLVSDTKMNGLANFYLDLKLADAPLDPLLTALEADDETAIQNIALDGMTLRIEDEKLLNFIYGVAGQQYGQDAEQMRQTAVGMMGFASMQAAQLGPDYVDYVSAVQGFMTDGGTLEISMAPKEKLTMAVLVDLEEAGPEAIPGILGLTVTHKK